MSAEPVKAPWMIPAFGGQLEDYLSAETIPFVDYNNPETVAAIVGFQPVGERVFALLPAQKKMTAGGLHIPDAALPKRQREATIIAVSNDDSGFAVGQRIAFGVHNGIPVELAHFPAELEGRVLALRYDEIMGVGRG